MKNTLRTLLIALLPAIAFAQETTNAAALKFGVNAGATFSNIRGNDIAETNDYALDFLVGLSLEVPISERLSFVTNINYERKSFTNEVVNEFDPDFDPIVDNSNRSDTRMTLSYLTIPLNIKYYLNAKKNFYINGGPFAGVFLGETLKVDGDKMDSEYNDFYKTLDFGINLGLGTNIALDEKNSLNIELRDNLGLANISDVEVVGDGTLKTHSVNLIVGWQFEL